MQPSLYQLSPTYWFSTCSLSLFATNLYHTLSSVVSIKDVTHLYPLTVCFFSGVTYMQCNATQGTHSQFKFLKQELTGILSTLPLDDVETHFLFTESDSVRSIGFLQLELLSSRMSRLIRTRTYYLCPKNSLRIIVKWESKHEGNKWNYRLWLYCIHAIRPPMLYKCCHSLS